MAFVEAVKKHNKTYHNKDKNVSAYLRQITHGHRSGEYLWIEGAMKMSLLDKKNDIKGHNEDWIKNIATKVISSDSNLYRNHPEYSSMSKSESGSGEIVFVRGFKQKNWKPLVTLTFAGGSRGSRQGWLDQKLPSWPLFFSLTTE